MRYLLVALHVSIIFEFAAAAAASTTITFGSGASPLALPYTENGLVFEQRGVSAVGVAGDVLFFFGEDNGLYHVRASSPIPFDLLSIDVKDIINVYSTTEWRIESPTGGVRALIPNVDRGTIDLTGTLGFTNVNYFDVVHARGGGRQALLIDKVVVQFVPEPTALVLALEFLGILMWRGRPL